MGFVVVNKPRTNVSGRTARCRPVPHRYFDQGQWKHAHRHI